MLNDALLDAVIVHLSPKSRRRLQNYVAEADFFDAVLSTDLNNLNPGSRVIEIGSGIGLLSLRAAAKGFEVAAYEPQSSGFSEMLNLRDLIITSWHGTLPDVAWRDTYFSSETAPTKVERAAFAINVLEHVPDIESLITDTMDSLIPGGRFRFICPNYAFPYEPHFEIPTFFNKSVTFRVFERRIRASAIENPVATWDDLSWPNVWKISKILRRMDLQHTFSRSATKSYLDRVAQDASFSARKGPAVRAMFHIGSAMAPTILTLTPTSLLPIIDCTIYRDH